MAHYQVLSAEGDVSFIADADMTAYQYRWVTLASAVGYVKLSTGGSNPTPLGVLQNSPSQNQEARVRMFGFSKLQGRATSTCVVKWGRMIQSASDGTTESTIQGSAVGFFNGRWLDTGVTDAGSAIGTGFIFPFGLGASPQAS